MTTQNPEENAIARVASLDLFNICDAVQCPYNTRQGCQRYSVSPHCHLAYPEPGVKRDGVETLASQYWLLAQHSVDMAAIRTAQDEWLASPDEIKRAEMIQRFKEN
jgi:hypothetical protein